MCENHHHHNLGSFLFANSYIKKVKHNCSCKRKCACKKKCKILKPNNYIFKLTKDDFLASSIAVSTSKESAWEEFLLGINNYIGSQLMISLRNCVSMHSLGACLLSSEISECKTEVTLLFKCNIIPSPHQHCNNHNCIKISTPVPIINDDCNTGHVYLPNGNYHLHDGEYHDLKFYFDANYVRTMCFVQNIV